MSPSNRPARNRTRATEQQVAALASSVRLRILRLTLDEAMTNKELAGRLGIDPASAHYHVRRLVDAGLLDALPPRPRAAGGLEIPYRSRGRSWALDLSDDERPTSAILEAFLAELSEIGTHRVKHAIRARAVVTPARRAELVRRLREVLDEFSDNDPDGKPWSVFIALHPDPPRVPPDQ